MKGHDSHDLMRYDLVVISAASIESSPLIRNGQIVFDGR